MATQILNPLIVHKTGGKLQVDVRVYEDVINVHNS